MDWEYYLNNEAHKADQMAKKDFGEKLMIAFKQKNILEGINLHQAIWLHSRMRAWEVSIPSVFGTDVVKVDIINMITAGDIETATVALQFGTADDMTKSYHWVSQERINWLVNQSKKWLGWQ